MEHLVRPLLRVPASALFRVRVRDQAHLDVAGGGPLIVAAVPHRNWVEPMLLLGLLPRTRRVVTIADRRTVTGSWWRVLAARSVGRALPVGAPARGERPHVAAVVRAIRDGAMVLMFPETGPPSKPPALRRLSAGVAWFAAASGAPVLPVVFGGTNRVGLGRAIEIRFLAPIRPPAADADRAAISAWMSRLRARVESEAATAHTAAAARQARH